MPKSKVEGAPPGTRRRKSAELKDVIEGQIGEICGDVAVQVKRMRQLQQQTDELRVVIRDWARESGPASTR